MNVKSLSETSGSEEPMSKLVKIEQDIDKLINLIEEFRKDSQSIGDWISEKQIIKMTGLGKSTLYYLRADGNISSSTISGKGVFYRKSDFERLLNENEKNT